MREMKMIPKNWELALKMWRLLKNNDKDRELIYINDKLYYKGVLLQEDKFGRYYYKPVIYDV